MTCNGDCNQGRECICDLDAKRITVNKQEFKYLMKAKNDQKELIDELESKLTIAIDALESVTDSLGGSYEQHAIRKKIQDLLGEVK
jgi:hypothetical protein